jgi:hypothetical protein
MHPAFADLEFAKLRVAPDVARWIGGSTAAVGAACHPRQPAPASWAAILSPPALRGRTAPVELRILLYSKASTVDAVSSRQLGRERHESEIEDHVPESDRRPDSP